MGVSISVLRLSMWLQTRAVLTWRVLRRVFLTAGQVEAVKGGLVRAKSLAADNKSLAGASQVTLSDGGRALKNENLDAGASVRALLEKADEYAGVRLRLAARSAACR